ncbi:DoxX family protein [Dactylosporangium sp. NPDC051541]|uniref:DoxX family protein n=1 Tax=Dactylosporangium sp. NPDC051541 TaxID=3363977 RepID=UPI003789D348
MRPVAYWTSTVVVVSECVVGGVLDLLKAPPFYPLMIELGYPPYLSLILGAAKVFAAAILIAPGLPRLKEWAYAGVLINMIGAGASQVATHRAMSTLLAPGAFAALALLSWAWRPDTRRLR